MGSKARQARQARQADNLIANLISAFLDNVGWSTSHSPMSPRPVSGTALLFLIFKHFHSNGKDRVQRNEGS